LGGREDPPMTSKAESPVPVWQRAWAQTTSSSPPLPSWCTMCSHLATVPATRSH
jgi:hypothetical protein